MEVVVAVNVKPVVSEDVRLPREVSWDVVGLTVGLERAEKPCPERFCWTSVFTLLTSQSSIWLVVSLSASSLARKLHCRSLPIAINYSTRRRGFARILSLLR